eukprot:8197674-Pyramimonas_sp.AAC.2
MTMRVESALQLGAARSEERTIRMSRTGGDVVGVTRAECLDHVQPVSDAIRDGVALQHHGDSLVPVDAAMLWPPSRVSVFPSLLLLLLTPPPPHSSSSSVLLTPSPPPPHSLFHPQSSS